MQDENTTNNFEASLKELEAIVRKMEQGELPLEQSLEAFEQGIQLTRRCQNALQNAQQKVQQLLADTETTGTLEPFTPTKDVNDV